MSVIKIPGILSLEFGEYIRRFFKVNTQITNPHKHKSNERLHLISSLILYLVTMYFYLNNNNTIATLSFIIAISISGLHLGQMYNKSEICHCFRTIITLCFSYMFHKNFKLVIWTIPIIALSCMNNLWLLTFIMYYTSMFFNKSTDIQNKSLSLFAIIASLSGVCLDKTCNIECGHELYHIAIAVIILITNMGENNKIENTL